MAVPQPSMVCHATGPHLPSLRACQSSSRLYACKLLSAGSQRAGIDYAPGRACHPPSSHNIIIVHARNQQSRFARLSASARTRHVYMVTYTRTGSVSRTSRRESRRGGHRVLMRPAAPHPTDGRGGGARLSRHALIRPDVRSDVLVSIAVTSGPTYPTSFSTVCFWRRAS